MSEAESDVVVLGAGIVGVSTAYAARQRGMSVVLVDRREPGGYVTPQEVTGQDGVFVSRVRVDPTVENGLSMWVVSDNLRKGAALNAIQIAEELIKGYI